MVWSAWMSRRPVRLRLAWPLITRSAVKGPAKMVGAEPVWKELSLVPEKSSSSSPLVASEDTGRRRTSRELTSPSSGL
jgi:hypothetical protein